MSQTQKSKKSPRMGGTFDEFLREEGMYEAIQTTAMRRILAMQLDGTAVGKLIDQRRTIDGVRPFRARGGIVTNELIDELREDGFS